MLETFFTTKFENEDISLITKDFSTNSFIMNTDAGKVLEIGFYKPFFYFYIELFQASTNALDLKYQYSTFSGWNDFDPQDETFKFKKSGFVSFGKFSDWEKSNSLYKIRIVFNETATIELIGIAPLFSDDSDLVGIRENIVSKYNNGYSWIKKHEQARNYIVKILNNSGHTKLKYDENIFGNEIYYRDDITAFDFLKPSELRLASAYKALAMIYLDELSDSSDDKWSTQGIRYEKEFNELMNNFMVKLDLNDDGINDDYELDSDDEGTMLKWE